MRTAQCSASSSRPAACNAAAKEQARAGRPELPWNWESFGEYLGFLRKLGIAVNVVPLVGHGTLRTLVLGPEDRAPTADEMAEMTRNSLNYAILTELSNRRGSHLLMVLTEGRG